MTSPQEEISQEEFEENSLRVLSPYIKRSLIIPLSERKEKIYCLSNILYSEYSFTRDTGRFTENDPFIKKIPNGSIDEFVESALKEENCVGIVPLTYRTIQTILNKGLKIVINGQKIEPERMQFDVYSY